MTEEYDDDKPFKITCQRCNAFVRCDVKSISLLYINFIYAGMSTLRLYLEELVPENLFFQWPGRTKVNHIYKSLLKEVNGNQKYLRWTALLYNNLEVLNAAIALDKLDIVCEFTV